MLIPSDPAEDGEETRGLCEVMYPAEDRAERKYVQVLFSPSALQKEQYKLYP
jgi:hypothetical protein